MAMTIIIIIIIMVIGEDCIIAKFFNCFKNLVNFYIVRNRLNLSVQLSTTEQLHLNLHPKYGKADLHKVMETHC